LNKVEVKGNATEGQFKEIPISYKSPSFIMYESIILNIGIADAPPPTLICKIKLIYKTLVVGTPTSCYSVVFIIGVNFKEILLFLPLLAAPLAAYDSFIDGHCKGCKSDHHCD
jgi:hypothetical protein